MIHVIVRGGLRLCPGKSRDDGFHTSKSLLRGVTSRVPTEEKNVYTAIHSSSQLALLLTVKRCTCTAFTYLLTDGLIISLTKALSRN